MRIACLSPAAGEILRLLDPPSARILPSPIDSHAQPSLNADALARLHADVILSDDPDHAELQIQDSEILIFHPLNPEDLLDAILRLGQILGSDSAAVRLMLRYRERLWRAQEHVNPYLDGPAVVVLENLHPLTIAGDPAAHLVERAGGRHVLHPSIAPSSSGSASGLQAGQRRAGPPRTIVPRDLARAGADIIVLAQRELRIEDMRSAWLESGLGALSPAARVVLLEGGAALYRPGIAMIDALEFFVALFHDRPAKMGSHLRWEELS